MESMKAFSKTTRKNIFTFLIGPLALIPAIVLGSIVMSIFVEGNNLLSTFKFGLFIAFFGLIVFAYPATLFVGIPSIMILERKGKYGLLPLILISLLVAAVISLMVFPSIFMVSVYCYSAVTVSLGCWYANKWFSAKL